MKTWEKILRYPIGLYVCLTDGIKNMSKKWKPAMAMLMAVVMLCGMLPITAMASGAGEIKVAGVTLRDTGYYDMTPGSVGTKLDSEPTAGTTGYVHWDQSESVLTLYSVTVDGGSQNSGIYANGDLEIVLAESSVNSVTSGYTNAITCDRGGVTVSGSGTLTATGATNGIKATYSVNLFENVNVTVIGNNGCGIVNNPSLFSNNLDPVRIAATATASVTGSTYGIRVNDGYGGSPIIDSPHAEITGGTAAFSEFPHGAPKLGDAIIALAGSNASDTGVYDSAAYSTYKYVKTAVKPSYTVSFNANGGTGTMADATNIYDQYQLPACGFTAPDGKQFKNWEVNGTAMNPGDKVFLIEDFTVKAIWEDIISHTCSIEPVEKVWPDCENGGKEAYYKCEGCGKNFEDAGGTTEIADIANWGNLPKTGHEYGTLKAAQPEIHTATELKAGVAAHYFCDECDTYFTEGKVATTLDALTGAVPSHNYATVNGYKGEDGHADTCACGAKDTVTAHTPDRAAATETDPVKCSVCEYEITPALGHTHAHGTEWKSDEDNHWNECACGDKANTAAHKDENADGKCDVCAYNVGLPTPPADPDNPQTGDNTQPGLWIALLAISSFGLAATAVYGKKRRPMK